MYFRYSLCFGAVTLMMLMALHAVTANTDNNIAAPEDNTAAQDNTAAEPSLYSTAYLSPKSIVVGPTSYNPYEGAVASTSTNIIRTPGNFGQVAAFHKTVETPFSSVHKADVRYTNDVLPYQLAGPYPYASPIVPGPYAAPVVPGPYPYAPAAGPYPYAPAGPYPYTTAGPYPYGAVAPVKGYGYGPSIAPQAYGYGPAVAPPYGYSPVGAPVVTPPAHSVSHASFSGPYGAPYSYKR